MADGKYLKYVFNEFDTADKTVGYAFPSFAGKIQTYVFDPFWHKSDFVKLWGEVNLHYGVGAVHGLGAKGFATVTGETPFGNVQEGDFLFRLGVHKHTADEMFYIFGTNPKNPGKLGGVYEFYLGVGEDAERYEFDTNTVIYVPAGVYHNPNGLLSIENPSHPIVQVLVMKVPEHLPGHFGDISTYAEDEEGNRIYPPGCIEQDN